jgi:hypothetical protein
VSDRFVATDADGRQHYEGYWKTWPLPVRTGDGWERGGVVEPDENGPVTFDAAELLEELGECIFVAELVDDAGAARLVKGTAWSEKVAAVFALDCVEHILRAVPGSADAELPGGATLAAIIASAREFLATGTGADGERLGFISRIAAARRLRREGTTIGDAAFAAAVQDEGADVDLLEDPAWATLAAARDAVLAAIETVRHVAFPFLVDRETRRYEAREEGPAINVDEVDTPWGAFPVGGGGPKYVPSWAAARDAAEHSRQAAADLSGPSEGEAERSWQAGRLVELLSAE